MTHLLQPRFSRYIGIDYSGAKSPTESLSGLRIFMATGNDKPMEVLPPHGPKRYWTRHGVAHWLLDRLLEDTPTLAGIDHSFSFPHPYFVKHNLPRSWDAFLEDFCRHWPTDKEYTAVDFLRYGPLPIAIRTGDAHWRRIAEVRCRAKSVFHFDVPGSVAKSTHAGLPWIRFIRRSAGTHVHCWPFDGWNIPEGRSVLTEVYPSICTEHRPRQPMTPDQRDAYAAARWLQAVDRDGSLASFLSPALTPDERAVACYEGWVLGVL